MVHLTFDDEGVATPVRGGREGVTFGSDWSDRTTQWELDSPMNGGLKLDFDSLANRGCLLADNRFPLDKVMERSVLLLSVSKGSDPAKAAAGNHLRKAFEYMGSQSGEFYLNICQWAIEINHIVASSRHGQSTGNGSRLTIVEDRASFQSIRGAYISNGLGGGQVFLSDVQRYNDDLKSTPSLNYGNRARLTEFANHLSRHYAGDVQLFDHRDGATNEMLYYTLQLPANEQLIQTAFDEYAVWFVNQLGNQKGKAKLVKGVLQMAKLMAIPYSSKTESFLEGKRAAFAETETLTTKLQSKELQFNLLRERIPLSSLRFGWTSRFSDDPNRQLSRLEWLLDFMANVRQSDFGRVVKALFKQMEGKISKDTSSFMVKLVNMSPLDFTTFSAMMRSWLTLAMATAMRGINFCRLKLGDIEDAKIEGANQDGGLFDIEGQQGADETAAEASWYLTYKTYKMGNKLGNAASSRESRIRIIPHKDVRMDARLALDEFLALRGDRYESERPFCFHHSLKCTFTYDDERDRDAVAALLEWVDPLVKCHNIDRKGSSPSVAILEGAEGVMDLVLEPNNHSKLLGFLKGQKVDCETRLLGSLVNAFKNKQETWFATVRKYMRAFNQVASFAITGSIVSGEALFSKDFNMHSIRALATNLALHNGCGRENARELGSWSGGKGGPRETMDSYVSRQVAAEASEVPYFAAWRKIQRAGTSEVIVQPPNPVFKGLRVKCQLSPEKRLRALKEHVWKERSKQWKSMLPIIEKRKKKSRKSLL
jgi:hypothetical protein